MTPWMTMLSSFRYKQLRTIGHIAFVYDKYQRFRNVGVWRSDELVYHCGGQRYYADLLHSHLIASDQFSTISSTI